MVTKKKQPVHGNAAPWYQVTLGMHGCAIPPADLALPPSATWSVPPYQLHGRRCCILTITASISKQANKMKDIVGFILTRLFFMRVLARIRVLRQ